MIQWGPDTAPRPRVGGGYHNGDTDLSGLSLTHLNGPGCPASATFRSCRRSAAIRVRPETTTAHFDPSSQHASPGSYTVTWGTTAVHVTSR